MKALSRSRQKLASNAVIAGALSLALATGAMATPAPIVTLKTTYYSVFGSDTDSINESIFTHSPIVVNGNSFAGITKNQYRTSYSAVSTSAGGCEAKNVRVELDSEVVLPQLTNGNRSYAVTAEWQRYIRALGAHEMLHHQNGKRVASELAARLFSAKSTKSCDVMRPQLDRAIDVFIDNMGKWDLSYDHTTQHGRTQGAFLRPGIR